MKEKIRFCVCAEETKEKKIYTSNRRLPYELKRGVHFTATYMTLLERFNVSFLISFLTILNSFILEIIQLFVIYFGFSKKMRVSERECDEDVLPPSTLKSPLNVYNMFEEY
jgi:hypothetical protein